MALAFWRDKRSTEKTRSNGPRTRGDGRRAAGDDPTAALRTRARRRFVGAIALLLAAVILVPLLLDPAPRPGADNIAIDIPSERQPFTPRLTLPPVPDPGQVPLAPEADAAPSSGSSASDKGNDTAGAAEKKAEAAPKLNASARSGNNSKERTAEAQEARPAQRKAEPRSEPKAVPKTEPKARKRAEPRPAEAAHAKGGKLLLQAAALGTEPAAQDLSERLRKAGFAPFIEKIETPDGVRYRVRVGPYSTRDEAQRAQARLRALGVSATLVTT